MIDIRGFGGCGRGAMLLVAALAGCGGGEESPRPLGQEGAHEHGVARVDLAVDGTRATVSFRAPAAEVYGFEREPVTEEERERRRAGLERVETRMGEALVFEPGLGCEVTIRERGWEGGHSGAGGEGHDDHDHDGGHGHDHDHDHDDHGDHGDHDHGDHDPDDHGDHDHDHDHDHGHGDSVSHGPGGHLDVTADFDVRCQAPLAGSRLRLAFGDVFPGIVDVDLQVVSGRTFGGRYRASGAGVEL